MNIARMKRNAWRPGIRVFLCCVLSFVFLMNVQGRKIRERQKISEKSTGTIADTVDCNEKILVNTCREAYAKIKNGAKGAFKEYTAEKFCTYSHWKDGLPSLSGGFFQCQLVEDKDPAKTTFRKHKEGKDITCKKDTCTKTMTADFVKSIIDEKKTPFVVASKQCMYLSLPWNTFDKTKGTAVGNVLPGATSTYSPGEFNVISAQTGNLCYQKDDTMSTWGSTGVQLATPLQHSQNLPAGTYAATNKVMTTDGHENQAKTEVQLAIALGNAPDVAKSGSSAGWTAYFSSFLVGGSTAAKL